MQTRSLVKERAQRNLLLLVDGSKSDEVLLSSVAGVTIEDIKLLESLALIVQVSGSSSSRRSQENAPATSAPNTLPAASAANSGAETQPLPDETLLDYPKFTATLTQLISTHLGLRGFTLTLAVEKANSIESLREVAARVITQIRDRKGDAAAEDARRALYGS